VSDVSDIGPLVKRREESLEVGKSKRKDIMESSEKQHSLSHTLILAQ
jgi:hypothetical protein